MSGRGSDGGCPVCGREIRAGAKFCGRCGALLPAKAAVCPACGRQSKPVDRFCRGCGAALVSAAEAAKPHPRRRRRLLIAVGVVAVLAAIAVGVTVPLTRDGLGSGGESGNGTESSAGGQMGAGSEASGVARIETGPAQEIARVTVGAEGGSVVVDKPGSLLDGMKLDVPAGAYSTPIDLLIAESPVTDLSLETEARALTPLIRIGGVESYADEVMTLTIPVTVPDDEVAMAFIYDPELGTLEGVPTVERTANSLTVATRHFCDAIVLSKFERELDKLDIDTRYRPGVDTWNIPNGGSYVAPVGFCHGMTLSSVWYFTQRRAREPAALGAGRAASGEDLWQPEYANGLDASKTTPDFWQDDAWAIQLCSLAQRVGGAVSVDDTLRDWRKRLYEAFYVESAKRPKIPTDSDTFYDIAFALAANPHQPHLLGLYRDRPDTPGWPATYGHSIVCYGIKDHTLKVADPNIPSGSATTIQYQDGRFESYKTYPYVRNGPLQNPTVGLAQNPTVYSYVCFDGLTSFFDMHRLQQLWTRYESGDLDSEFPHYAIEIIELDEQGAEVSRRGLDLGNGTTVTSRRVSFKLGEVNDSNGAAVEGNLTVYRFEDRHQPVVTYPMQLEPGENLLGFYVEGKKDDGWWWTGFDWVTITRVEEPQQTAPLDYNRCTIRWTLKGMVWAYYSDGQLAYKLDDYPHSPVWEMQDMVGSFVKEDTFVAQWTQVNRPDRPEDHYWSYETPSPSDTARRGELRVVFDPVTHEAVEFKFDNTVTGADDRFLNSESLVGGRLQVDSESPGVGLCVSWDALAPGKSPTPTFTYTQGGSGPGGTGPPDGDTLIEFELVEVQLHFFKAP